MVQQRTHQWIQSTWYLCNGRIFDRLLCTSNEGYKENSLKSFVDVSFTLLFVPFESKLVNFSTGRQDIDVLYRFWKRIEHKRWINLYSKVTKDALFIVLQIFVRCLSRIYGLTFTAGRQKFVQYILWIYWCVLNCI